MQLPDWLHLTHRQMVWGITFLFFALYLWSRWFGLTILPVFADESIYIRWAQLASHDQAYWFFSLNDGKPPLFIWSLIPPLNFFSDPLWVARSVSAVVGLAQLGLTVLLVKRLGGKLLAQGAAATIVLVAPFWVLHHRLGLMDGMLTLWITLSFWGLVGISQLFTLKKVRAFPSNTRQLILNLTAASAGLGLALYTKTPALFFTPTFLVMAYLWPLTEGSWQFWKEKHWLKWLLIRTSWFGLAGFMGLLIFATLRIHPAFGSLFGRSTDFTYTVSEFFALGGQPLLSNIQRIIPWLSEYLRPELLSFALIALVVSRQAKKHWILWLCAAIFLSPFFLLGKTLHARYLMPSIIFFTVGAALFVEEAWNYIEKKEQQVALLVFGTLVGFFLLASLRFLLLLQFTPQQTPFILDDRSQYLMEWSAGYGIPEVRDRLLELSRANQRVTVVTEGSFGTLPDGLLMYFDRAPEIKNLRIEGLAQYPVKFLPEWVVAEAQNHETWLLVNENRLQLPQETMDTLELIGKYARPYGAPPLLVFRVKPQ